MQSKKQLCLIIPTDGTDSLTLLSRPPPPLCFNSDGLITCGDHHTPNLRITGAEQYNVGARRRWHKWDKHDECLYNEKRPVFYYCLNLTVGALLTVFWPEATQLRQGNGTGTQHCCCHCTTFSLLYPAKGSQRPTQMKLFFMGLLGNVKILDLNMEALCPCISQMCRSKEHDVKPEKD